MSKNIKRVLALAIVMAIVVSAFSVIGMVNADEEYKAVVTGWPSKLNAGLYPWFADGVVTDGEKDDTHAALADELVYQNTVLGYKMGIVDGYAKNAKGEYEWKVTDNWGDGVVVQIDNYDKTYTDNTTNPWNAANRYWGMVSAPYVGMAFSLKGAIAEHPYTDNQGLGLALLGNQYEKDGVLYQQRVDSYTTVTAGNVLKREANRFPGSNNAAIGKDMSNGKFKYAYARYSQENKLNYDGKTKLTGAIGIQVASGGFVQTKVPGMLYQEFVGPGGGAYIVGVNPAEGDNDYTTGAYVIDANIKAKFDSLGADMEARLAITGLPIEDTKGLGADATQRFEKGTLSNKGNFESSVCEIINVVFPSITLEKPLEIDQARGRIVAYVPAATQVTSLNPTITINGASVSPTGPQDFTNPVEYTVTATNGDTKKYLINVVVEKATDITKFEIGGIEAEVDTLDGMIVGIVPGDTVLTNFNLAAAITTKETGVTVSPATADLSNSWNNPVKVTVSKGAETTIYNVKIRPRSKANDIISFTIPTSKFKYKFADARENVIGTISGTDIEVTYPTGATTDFGVAPQVIVSEGATVDVKPTTVQSQVGRKYTVTSENGEKKVYTVTVKILPGDALYRDTPEILISFTSKGFDGKARTKLAEAIQKEYENQLKNYMFDAGDPLGNVETWDGAGVTTLQKFVNGMGSTPPNFPDAGVTAIITADVPGGLAYTVKGKIFDQWTPDFTDEDSGSARMYGNSGSAATNEFKMDGVLYQQFALSYAWYGATPVTNPNRAAQGMQTVGIGNYRRAQLTDTVKQSLWFDEMPGLFKTDVTFAFREGYERSNMIGYNPGVAFNPNVPYAGTNSPLTFPGRFTYIGGDKPSTVAGATPIMTEDTFMTKTHLDTKGQKFTYRYEGKFENVILYQMFYGAGDINSKDDRSKTSRAAVIKGADKFGVDNGGSFVITNDTKYAEMKKMYEALNDAVSKPKEYEGKNFDYVELSVGEKIGTEIDPIKFMFNRDLGTPSNYLINDKGEFIMAFVLNEVVESTNTSDGAIKVFDADGNEKEAIPVEGAMTAYQGRKGYFKAPTRNIVGGVRRVDLTKIEWVEGDIYSNNNLLKEAFIAGTEIHIFKRDEVYPADLDLVVPEGTEPDPKALKPRKFGLNTIYINFAENTPLDIQNLKFDSLFAEEQKLATITSPKKATVGYEPLNCEDAIPASVIIEAENEDIRSYVVYVYKNGVPQGDPFIVESLKENSPWGFWNEKQIVYPRTSPDGFYEFYKGSIPEDNPNLQLSEKDKDGNWQPLWEEIYGYYTIDGDRSSPFVEVGRKSTGKPWKEKPSMDVWVKYCEDHNIKKG